MLEPFVSQASEGVPMLCHDRSKTPDRPPSGVHGAAAEIASLRQLALQRALLALTAAAVAGFVASSNLRLGVAFAIGSIGELALAGGAETRRRSVLLVLATDREGYELAEVQHFGASLTAWRKRLALAHAIEELLRDASRSESIFLLDRVAAHAPALAAIARSLADEKTSVEPIAMATLVQLLTDGGRSPLLSRTAPPAELEKAVARILSGIHPRRGLAAR